jgi:anti-anti-sigma factor
VNGSKLTISASGFPTLLLSGELDLAFCDEMTTLFDELTQAGPCVLVDLQAVTFVGSSPIGQLLALHHRLSDSGGTLAVVSNNANLLHIFDMTGLDRLLHVFWTVHEAETYLRSVW